MVNDLTIGEEIILAGARLQKLRRGLSKVATTAENECYVKDGLKGIEGAPEKCEKWNSYKSCIGGRDYAGVENRKDVDAKALPKCDRGSKKVEAGYGCQHEKIGDNLICRWAHFGTV